MNYTLTENMKIWLHDLYLEGFEEFYGGASNLHLMALGSDGEEASQLEMYANEQRKFAYILESMAEDVIKEE